jgi:hypothetical protein
VRFHAREKSNPLGLMSYKEIGAKMPDANPKYWQMITACDTLMKNSTLSLYGEVAIIKAKVRKARANDGVLKQLTSDLSFLVDRLSSSEKRTYLSCCEDGKETKMWDSTEP